MKAKGSDSAAVVEFTGRVQRMARGCISMYSLKDRPQPSQPDVQYAARPLLGFTRDDEQMIEDIIIRHPVNKYCVNHHRKAARELARLQTRGILHYEYVIHNTGASSRDCNLIRSGVVTEVDTA